MAVHINHNITANMTKGEDEGADRNLWLEKMIYL